MTNDLRVVVDTNVLISGLFGIKDSPSSQILNDIRNQKIILVTSSFILEKIGEVINRERIIKLTKMSPKERKEIMEMLIERSDIAQGKQLTVQVGRDIKDDIFLACAVETKANYIVSGDTDLLVLNHYKDIKIITPREFLTILKK